MIINALDQLAALIRQDPEALLARWRRQVRHLPSARHLDVPTLNDHIPGLLKELAAALETRTDATISEALRDGSPPEHGLQRVADGFDIAEVVAEYNILRGCIHDLADSNGLRLQGEPFHIINRVLNQAIGLAVETFAARQAAEVQRRREDYLAFVAHDLRTPLNAIALASRVLELTLTNGDASAETVQMFRALRRNVQHLDGLVLKVLDETTNLQADVGVKLQRREFDLWPLVEGLIHDVRPVAEAAGTQLRNAVPYDLRIFADASLFRRIVQNLIGNAIKYTPRGEVVIAAREPSEGEAVECWVSDNGAGIPEYLLDKVFEKGETDPHTPGGTGLGLSIVKAFVEAHGGTVSVESREGAGTTFRFSLPRKADHARQL